MRFKKSHAGKWVASRGGEVIATGKKLGSVMGRVESKKGKQKIIYTLVPKGLITGYAI